MAPKAISFDLKYIPEPNSGCWLWLMATDRDGYPVLSVYAAGEYRQFRVQRLMCEGLQEGELACHTCDQRLCINPDHLYRGTPQSNMDDKVRRGRLVASPGISNGMARLTEAMVKAIRADTRPYPQIAAAYGTSVPNICVIKQRKTWRHIE
jgi:hypothetical protein